MSSRLYRDPSEPWQVKIIIVLLFFAAVSLAVLFLLLYTDGDIAPSQVQSLHPLVIAQPPLTPTTVIIVPSLTPTATMPPSTDTPSPSPTSTRTPTQTDTPVTPLYTPAPFYPQGSLPAEASISGITGHRQTLPLSCEAQAATDWAAFFGVEIDERQFQRRLPRSDNPDTGFVGDVNGKWGQIPPHDYGVHAGPVAALLREYGLKANSRVGMTWKELLEEIAAGRPVIVWVIGHVNPGTGVIYIDHDGQKVVVAPYEHVVMVTGYQSLPEPKVTIQGGTKVYERTEQQFMRSWAVLGYMAIVEQGE